MKSVDLDTSEVISIAHDVIYNDNDNESISVENGRTENSNKRKHSSGASGASGASGTSSPKLASEVIKVPGRNENLKLKVAALFTEGLKIARIGTFNVERKINKSGRDGVVVVSCKSRDDRESILSAKNKLKVSRQYSNIYIHPDMTLQQRIESENMRVLAKTLKSVNPDLRVRGSRLVDESARSDSQSNARFK
ncbi:Hypothetical predicted protein [Mytilus galloprovincialis]|uniref:Uncharacterized protein n=1 Tax=Mytilus galloprovincialis TaxID=29158 RepID=A0A8B6GU13_MYTGA|nr:Hypothetical predicted protein [Mytilus galloprovincialis]